MPLGNVAILSLFVPVNTPLGYMSHYRPQQSCGKVMYTVMSVCYSVHWAGGGFGSRVTTADVTTRLF